MQFKFSEPAITSKEPADTRFFERVVKPSRALWKQLPSPTEHEARSSDESALLAAELTSEGKRARRKMGIGIAAILLSVPLPVIFFGRIGFFEHYYQLSSVSVLLAYLAFLLPLAAITGTSVMMIRYRKALGRKVQRLRAVRSMGASTALTETLSHGDTKARRSAARGLLDIVPKWTEDDLAAIGPRQRRSLHSFMVELCGCTSPSLDDGGSSDVAFTALRLVLCETLGRIGDYSDLEVLRQVADNEPPSGKWPSVLRSAQTAVRTLEARLADQIPQRQLLRASALPTAVQDELLRAAAPCRVEDTESLLRPDNAERKEERA